MKEKKQKNNHIYKNNQTFMIKDALVTLLYMANMQSILKLF